MSKAVAIVSGGMDSVTMLYWMMDEGLETAVISFTYGQKHTREIEAAKWHVAKLGISQHQIIDLQPFANIFSASALVNEDIVVPDSDAVQGDPQPATYVPNRNMIFLALSAAYAESQDCADVYYGAQASDLYGYWDCTPDFLANMNTVFSLNRKTPMKIHAPFVNRSKADILRLGYMLSVDYGQTWSCYNGGESACGDCPTCAERLRAFEDIGLEDPLKYIQKEGH